MNKTDLQIGFVTDEVTRDLVQAFRVCESWGIRLFELREGRANRFPYFEQDEMATVRSAVERGSKITAVSPGLFKSPIEDSRAIERDLLEKLPVALERSSELGCSRMIVFGFEMREKTAASRNSVVDIMRRACDLAHGAGIELAVENEPAFWFDTPEDCVELLSDIGHASLKLNWDPANMHWGGRLPTRNDFETVRPHVVNLHVKDFFPDDPRMPWRPVGEGVTPWAEILGWVQESRADGFELDHLTIETHYEPAEDGSRRSLENVRSILQTNVVKIGLE